MLMGNEVDFSIQFFRWKEENDPGKEQKTQDGNMYLRPVPPKNV